MENWHKARTETLSEGKKNMIGIPFIVIGVLFLYFGAEYLVRGGSSIALIAGIKKIVIGLTIVSFGTSLPEFIVSFFSALKKVDSVCVGNVVGSNVINILLVLGIASVVRPIKSSGRVMSLDMPFLIFLSLVFSFLCIDGLLSRVDGAILFLLFVAYLWYILKKGKKESFNGLKEGRERGSVLKYTLFTVGGLIGLVVGGHLTVRGAVIVAKSFGIPELFIGLTVVALGTSLPELFTSVVAMIKKEEEISLGNIIGSNLFNLAFILGFISIFNPLIIEQEVIRFNNIFMVGVTFLLSLFLYTGKKISRGEGMIFIALYVLFVTKLIVGLNK